MMKVCIVGGGPAGLATAHALQRAGIEYRLFDAGPPLLARRHDCADDLGAGIGGAGLFSDGKFSYFPSGTALYQIGNAALLRLAYGAVARLLGDIGIARLLSQVTTPSSRTAITAFATSPTDRNTARCISVANSFGD